MKTFKDRRLEKFDKKFVRLNEGNEEVFWQTNPCEVKQFLSETIDMAIEKGREKGIVEYAKNYHKLQSLSPNKEVK